MAHRNRIRLAGTWTAGSVILPAEMETFDAAQYAEIDGDAGGTWAPAARIILGGAGMRVTGPLTADDFDGTVTAGKILTFNFGSTLTQAFGAVGNFGGTNTLTGPFSTSGAGAFRIQTNGGLSIGSAGIAYVGGKIVIQATPAGTLDVYGTMTFFGDSFLNIDGTLGHFAVTHFGQYSGTVWQNGAVVSDGGNWSRHGSETWTSGGDVHFAANSNLYLEADSLTTFNGTAGNEARISIGSHCLTTIASTSVVVDQGAWTRSGVEVWSGSGSITVGGTTTVTFGNSTALTLGSELMTVTGAQPAPTDVPAVNQFSSTIVTKAWGSLTTDGAGHISVVDGYNIDSVVLNAPGTVTVLFARKMASANYVVSVDSDSLGVSSKFGAITNFFGRSATQFSFQVSEAGDLAHLADLNGQVYNITFQIMGRQ